MNPIPKSVPEPALRRLPLYHRFLKESVASGREYVSCTDIGADLKLDPTQVRKDLEAAGIEGRPRVGYVLCDLLVSIERFLGWNNVHETFLEILNHKDPKVRADLIKLVRDFAVESARRDRLGEAIGVLGSSRATNEEGFLAQKFARLVLGSGNVDCCARFLRHGGLATANPWPIL